MSLKDLMPDYEQNTYYNRLDAASVFIQPES